MKYQKPNKYNFFRHLGFALNGFKNMVKEENAAKIHVAAFIIMTIVLFFIPFNIISKIILFCSMFFVLIGEAINTSIERVVDLASPEYHELAKQSKDIAALVVLLFFILTAIIWISTILYELDYIF